MICSQCMIWQGWIISALCSSTDLGRSQLWKTQDGFPLMFDASPGFLGWLCLIGLLFFRNLSFSRVFLHMAILQECRWQLASMRARILRTYAAVLVQYHSRIFCWSKQVIGTAQSSHGKGYRYHPLVEGVAKNCGHY